MKTLKYLFFIVIILTSFSCKNDASSKKEITETIAIKENLQRVEIHIEGMTCEIGCAKLIASKIHKLEGVKTSKVDFENNIGIFTFDKNKTSSEDIIKNINGIAGGELYKATDSKTLD